MLAERVENFADTLASFRINSISEQVDQLRQISQEIRDLSEGNDVPSLKDVAARTLPVLLQLFDALSTQEGARIIISGATTGILGAGGWPSAVIFTVAMAAWYGKDAFVAALGKLSKSSADGGSLRVEGGRLRQWRVVVGRGLSSHRPQELWRCVFAR